MAKTAAGEVFQGQRASEASPAQPPWQDRLSLGVVSGRRSRAGGDHQCSIASPVTLVGAKMSNVVALTLTPTSRVAMLVKATSR